MIRGATAAALLLAACSRAPDAAHTRLLGTWRPVPSEAIEKDIRELGSCSADGDRAFGTDPVAYYCDQRALTFEPDGSWRTKQLAADPLAPKRTWTLLEDRGDNVKVSMTGVPLEKRATEVTFTFLSANECRNESDGMRYTLVSAPK